LRLSIQVTGDPEQLASLLQDHALADDIIADTNEVVCLWRGDRETLPALHRSLVEANILIVSFAVKSDNLEDIYMRISKHRTA